jgi:hypothetical protein
MEVVLLKIRLKQTSDYVALYYGLYDDDMRFSVCTVEESGPG